MTLQKEQRMYYSSGNYEAFAPRKPAGVDGKRAWFVGSGWPRWPAPRSWCAMAHGR
jgi:hypothetical protein